MIVTAAAHAGFADGTASQPVTPEEYCTEIAGVAKEIEHAHQSGMTITSTLSTFPDSTREHYTPLVVQLYRDYPRMQTQEYRVQQITKAENDIFVDCMDKVSKK
jgi:hypothetical protein